MILGLLLVSLLTTQLFLLGREWLGAFAPDPILVAAALCALTLSPRRMLLAAVLLGWGRAVGLLEPAGGQILCAYGAMAVLAGLRSQFLLLGGTGFFLAALLGAGCWSLLAHGLAWISGRPVTGGWELLLGAGLACCVPFLLRRAAARAGVAA